MVNSRKPTISACMIVKNEEEFLPNCLISVKNAVDEIVIVDTGSTDDTVAIAKHFGAKVYHHPWNDSFSDARNHSLRYATGDWILQIDADEELEQMDIPRLWHAMGNKRYNGIVVTIQSIIRGDMHRFYNTRVFRRNNAFYRDIIHEQLIIEGERLPTEIRLYHYGYNLDEKKMQIKWQRTTSLLRKQIAQNKFNGFAWFNLIRNYRTQKLYQDGIDTGKEALGIITPETNLHHYTMIIYETANCCLHKEYFSEAKELCTSALSELAKSGVTPENMDIIFTLAHISLKEGNYREAIDCFNKFLSLREWHLKNMHVTSLMIDTLGYDYAAHNGLGYCFVKMDQQEAAIIHFRSAITINPKHLETYKNLAFCYSNTGNHGEAINTLLETISEGIADDDVFLKLGDLHIEQGFYEKAITYLEEYLKKRPEEKSTLLKIARCYEQLGHLEAAMVGYRMALEKNK